MDEYNKDRIEGLLDRNYPGWSSYNVLKEFDVYHHGWECDQYGWIVELEDKKRILVLTNHGMPYIAEKVELTEKIREYTSAIMNTELALDYLDEFKEPATMEDFGDEGDLD